MKDRKLEELIHIGVAIGAGSEYCTKESIITALESGCSKKQIKKVVSMISSLKHSRCFCKAVGVKTIKKIDALSKTALETLENKIAYL